MRAKIFYAWQLDSDRKQNKQLIQSAAEAACKRISDSDENSWEVTLDMDTSNTPGMCDIPNTILRKIADCDVFLCDLTLVGETDGGGKKMPNSNVVFELGFAANALSFEAIVGVYNKSVHEPTEQIFDIKRRNAIGYQVGGDLKKSANQLSKTLEAVFILTLDQVVRPKREASQGLDDEAFDQFRTSTATKLLAGNLHGYSDLPATLIIAKFIDPPELADVFSQLHDSRFDVRMDGDTVVWKNYDQLFELHANGTLAQIDGSDFMSFRDLSYPRMAQLNSNLPKEVPKQFREQRFQVNIVKNVAAVVRALATLGDNSNIKVGISVVGIAGFTLANKFFESKEFNRDIVHLQPVVVSSETFDDNAAIATSLRLPINQLCRQVGNDSTCFTSNGTWSVRLTEDNTEFRLKP